MKGVVITPYYLESDETIEQCILSVNTQTRSVNHVLIADGFPRDRFDNREGLGLTHIRNLQHYHDWGNVPRTIAMLANKGAPFIAFLDADCTYDADHIEICRATAAQADGCDYVATQERFLRPTKDGGTVVSSAKAEPQEQHVDTNCFFLFPQCYDVAIEALTNRPDPYRGDRHLYSRLKDAGLRAAFTNRQTVTYMLSSIPAEIRHPLP